MRKNRGEGGRRRDRGEGRLNGGGGTMPSLSVFSRRTGNRVFRALNIRRSGGGGTPLPSSSMGSGMEKRIAVQAIRAFKGNLVLSIFFLLLFFFPFPPV